MRFFSPVSFFSLTRPLGGVPCVYGGAPNFARTTPSVTLGTPEPGGFYQGTIPFRGQSPFNLPRIDGTLFSPSNVSTLSLEPDP